MILLISQVYAFTTNSSDQTFDFTITSGKNNELNSSNFKSYLVVGDITNEANSSNFKTKIGFLRIAPYLNGEACEINSECVGDFCCSSLCQSTACATTTSTGSTTGGGGGGGSSGGGGGGAPTGAGAISAIVAESKAQVWSEIPGGSSVIMNIDESTIAVTAILVNDITLTLNGVELEVLALTENPLQSEPSSTIYQYFNINKKNIEEGDAGSINIRFRIPKIWLIENNLASEDILLYRYNNRWDELTTRVTGADEIYVNYESDTPGFSTFALGIKKSNLFVSPGSIKVKLNRGGVSEKILTIKSSANSKQNISINIKGVNEFLSLSKNKFELDPGESAEVKLNFIAKRIGSFTGQIIVNADKIEKVIPIIFEVIPLDVLFDAILIIDPDSKKIVAGQDLKTKISIKNLRYNQYTVAVRYMIKDLNNEIIYEETETLNLDKDITIEKVLKIPEDINGGFYVAVVEVLQDNEIGAISSDIFEVVEKIKIEDIASFIIFKTLLYGVLIILILVVLGTLRFFVIKSKKIKILNQTYWSLTDEINSKIKAKKYKGIKKLYKQLVLVYEGLLIYPLDSKIKTRMKKNIDKIRKKIK